MKVIIIEDEPLMASLLEEKILQVDDSIKVITQLKSIKEAIEYMEEGEHPDLFFSDIQLSDGLSFEIFKRIENTLPVIFCTAYNDYALDAFKVYGIDYLLKPYDIDDIKSALTKYYTLTKSDGEQSIDYDAIYNMISNQKQTRSSSVLIYRGDEIIPLATHNISIAGLDDGHVYVYDLNQNRHRVKQNIEELDDVLGPNFYRLNRQYIINRKSIDHISYYFNRKLLVHPTFKFREKLFVSKAKSRGFLSWLESH